MNLVSRYALKAFLSHKAPTFPEYPSLESPAHTGAGNNSVGIEALDENIVMNPEEISTVIQQWYEKTAKRTTSQMEILFDILPWYNLELSKLAVQYM